MPIGTARLLLAPIVLVAALSSAAAAKALTGLASGPSLAVALLLAAGAGAAIWWLERSSAWRPDAEMFGALALAGLAIAGLLAFLLYNPLLEGMVNAAYQPD